MATDKDSGAKQPIELEEADVEKVVGGLKTTTTKPVKRPTGTHADPEEGGE